MITSGSGLERFMYCRASNVLQRTFDERDNTDATRGREIHGYLQRLGEGMTVEASLEAVDERYRDAAAEVDLEDLKDVLGLSPEMTIAYNPVTDTARVLGSGLDRQYEEAGLEEDEIPVTMDVIGLDRKDGPVRGVVVDYKTGWGRIAPTHKNWQMKGGALALARAFDLDEVVAQLIYLREGKAARRDRAVFSAADLAAIAGEARMRHALAMSDRALYVQSNITPDAVRGSWCKYCPSFFSCPGQIGLMKAMFAPGGELAENPGPLGPDQIADAYRRMEELKPAWGHLKKSILAAARERPVLIQTLDNGTQLWLGLTEVVGNEKLDADITRQVVRELLDDQAADEVCAFTVSKDRIATAAKKRVPKGKGASKEREIYAEIKRRRGSHRPVKHEVDVYSIKPEQLGHQLAKTGS